MASSGCAFSFAVRAELIEAGAFSPPLGLSFSKPAYRPRTVRAEPVEALACWFDRHAWVEGGGRESPGVRVTFFCFAKRKSPKKRRPPVCDPFAVRRGDLRRGGCGVRRGTRFALARAARTSTASQFTKHARFDARAHPATAPPQAQPAGVDSRTSKQPNSRTSIRAIAALGPGCAARGACAREMGPSAAQRSNGPCGCPHPGFPSARAEKRRAGGACVCRRTHALRALTCRSCLNGARSAQ